MSKPLQINLPDAKGWLSRETKGVVEPLNEKAAGLLKEIKVRVDDTEESGRKILQNSEGELGKNNPKTYRFARNANKFGENLTDTLKTITVPEDGDYQKLYAFYESLEKTVASLDQLRRNGYPYISPYFIFDRRRLDVSLKRLSDITRDLREFMTTKYVKAKTVEHAYSLIDRLAENINESKQSEESIRLNGDMEKTLQTELSELRDRIADVQSRAELNELMKLNQKIEELRGNVKHNLRYLQKPFYKLQSMARVGEVAVPPDELNKLSDYLNDPFMALATDSDDYMTLKSILRRLDGAVSQGKMKLKSTRLRKAQDQIDSLLNKGSLAQLQSLGKNMATQRNQLLASDAVKESEAELKRLQSRLEQLHKESEFASSKVKSLHAGHEKLKERMAYHRNELEKSINQVTGKSVQIMLSA